MNNPVKEYIDTKEDLWIIIENNDGTAQYFSPKECTQSYCNYDTAESYPDAIREIEGIEVL